MRRYVMLLLGVVAIGAYCRFLAASALQPRYIGYRIMDRVDVWVTWRGDTLFVDDRHE